MNKTELDELRQSTKTMSLSKKYACIDKIKQSLAALNNEAALKQKYIDFINKELYNIASGKSLIDKDLSVSVRITENKVLAEAIAEELCWYYKANNLNVIYTCKDKVITVSKDSDADAGLNAVLTKMKETTNMKILHDLFIHTVNELRTALGISAVKDETFDITASKNLIIKKPEPLVKKFVADIREKFEADDLYIKINQKTLMQKGDTLTKLIEIFVSTKE